MRRLCDRDVAVAPELAEPVDDPGPGRTRAHTGEGLVHGVLFAHRHVDILLARAEAGLEQDHVRDFAQGFQRRLRRGEVIQRAVTEYDVEPAEPPYVRTPPEIEH